MPVEVTLRKVEAYEVITAAGESLGRFDVGKTWHNMLEMTRGADLLIVDYPQSWASVMFGGDKEVKLAVIKASDSISPYLHAIPPEATKSGDACGCPDEDCGACGSGTAR